MKYVPQFNKLRVSSLNEETDMVYNNQLAQYAPRPVPYGCGRCCPLAPLPSGGAFPGAAELQDCSAIKQYVNSCIF